MSRPPPRTRRSKFKLLVTDERKAELFKNDPKLRTMRAKADELLRIFNDPGRTGDAYRELMKAYRAWIKAHRARELTRYRASAQLLALSARVKKRKAYLVYEEGMRILCTTRERINWRPQAPEVVHKVSIKQAVGAYHAAQSDSPN